MNLKNAEDPISCAERYSTFSENLSKPRKEEKLPVPFSVDAMRITEIMRFMIIAEADEQVITKMLSHFKGS